MRSPLPDSSNLEAGILEDAVPSRLSCVHDNVRDLLRQSVFGAFHVSPTSSQTNGSPHIRVLPSPVTKSEPRRELRPENPAEATPVSLSTEMYQAYSFLHGAVSPAVLLQPMLPRQDIQM